VTRLRRSALFLCLVLPAGLLAACTDAGDAPEATITEVREVSPPRPPVDPDLPTADRLGIRFTSGESETAPPPVAPPAAQTPEYRYETPAGWEPRPPTMFRQANFVLADDPATEVYLSVLPGGAGGIADNLNRWRRQMGLPPYAEEEIAALPRVEVAGHEGLLVAFEGTFTGMRGEMERPGYALRGAVADAGDHSLFVKMVGPAGSVEEQSDAVQSFAASLERVEAEEPSAEPARAMGGDTPDGAQGFTWDVPEGWQRAEDRPMRVATFTCGPGNAVECYVSTLGAGAGGTLANVNRWLNQMGEEPVTESQLAALPEVSLLGEDVPLVAAQGDYTDVTGATAENYGLLGAMRELPQATVFVKMVGPRDAVAAERERFVAFCESIKR
jgi:hypothetical protein